MLLAACASRYLWAVAGGAQELAVGDWQVAHVASLLGYGDLALRFASSCLARTEANGWDDWRLASAHEGMARAHATLCDAEARDRSAAACRHVLATLDDADDVELISAQLATIPGIATAV